MRVMSTCLDAHPQTALREIHDLNICKIKDVRLSNQYSGCKVLRHVDSGGRIRRARV